MENVSTSFVSRRLLVVSASPRLLIPRQAGFTRLLNSLLATTPLVSRRLLVVSASLRHLIPRQVGFTRLLTSLLTIPHLYDSSLSPHLASPCVLILILEFPSQAGFTLKPRRGWEAVRGQHLDQNGKIKPHKGFSQIEYILASNKWIFLANPCGLRPEMHFSSW